MVGGGKNRVFIKPLALGRMGGRRNGWADGMGLALL